MFDVCGLHWIYWISRALCVRLVQTLESAELDEGRQCCLVTGQYPARCKATSSFKIC